MAGNNKMKRLGVFAVVILLSVSVILGIVMYILIETPPILVAVLGVGGIAMIAVLVYEAMIRLREIEEGVDDAVNDY